jgi:hypothetical protein
MQAQYKIPVFVGAIAADDERARRWAARLAGTGLVDVSVGLVPHHAGDGVLDPEQLIPRSLGQMRHSSVAWLLWPQRGEPGTWWLVLGHALAQRWHVTSRALHVAVSGRGLPGAVGDWGVDQAVDDDELAFQQCVERVKRLVAEATTAVSSTASSSTRPQGRR